MIASRVQLGCIINAGRYFNFSFIGKPHEQMSYCYGIWSWENLLQSSIIIKSSFALVVISLCRYRWNINQVTTFAERRRSLLLGGLVLFVHSLHKCSSWCSRAVDHTVETGCLANTVRCKFCWFNQNFPLCYHWSSEVSPKKRHSSNEKKTSSFNQQNSAYEWKKCN